MHSNDIDGHVAVYILEKSRTMLQYIIPPYVFRKYYKWFHNGSDLIHVHVSYKWKIK